MIASPFPTSLRLGALAVLAIGALVAFAPRAASARPQSPPTREVTITIHYSRFSPDRVEVPAGVPITFTLRNDDAIDHEWLIGDEAFHARHRAGTESVHGDRPDEISLPALTTRSTTLVFEKPATLTFVCHFPRHEAYGMVGVLTVR